MTGTQVNNSTFIFIADEVFGFPVLFRYNGEINKIILKKTVFRDKRGYCVTMTQHN